MQFYPIKIYPQEQNNKYLLIMYVTLCYNTMVVVGLISWVTA